MCRTDLFVLLDFLVQIFNKGFLFHILLIEGRDFPCHPNLEAIEHQFKCFFLFLEASLDHCV